MLSGHYAAKSILQNPPGNYDLVWKKRFKGLMQTSVVNRVMYAMAGNFGYRRFIKGVVQSRDARNWIKKRYNPGFWQSMFYPFAQYAFNKRLTGICVQPDCYCAWCRCQHET